MKLFLTLLLSIALILISNTASAHGLATSKTELVGQYLLEFEYDTLGNVQVGSLTDFNFEMLNPDTKESIEFQRAFVKFSKPSETPEGRTIYDTVFSGNLFQMSGFGRKSARANIMIPKAGNYEARVSFYSGSDKLAEHTFTFTVDEAFQKDEAKSEKGFWPFVSIGTFVIGLLGGLAIRKSRKKRENNNDA